MEVLSKRDRNRSGEGANGEAEGASGEWDLRMFTVYVL